MSLYIPTIKMPMTCSKCRDSGLKFAIDALGLKCPERKELWGPTEAERKGIRRADCPLIEVPPHGSAAIEKVISERISQIERWGEDTYNHPFEWMSILGEEFGELCEAVNETCFMNGTHPERGGDENIVREATQIAAVAVAIIEAFLPSDTAPTIIRVCYCKECQIAQACHFQKEKEEREGNPFKEVMGCNKGIPTTIPADPAEEGE